jgi:Ca2+-binding EF-hand superfamily protein
LLQYIRLYIDVWKKFKVVDENKDGKLDIDEFREFIKCNKDIIKNDDTDKIFAEIDKNY